MESLLEEAAYQVVQLCHRSAGSQRTPDDEGTGGESDPAALAALADRRLRARRSSCAMRCRELRVLGYRVEAPNLQAVASTREIFEPATNRH